MLAGGWWELTISLAPHPFGLWVPLGISSSVTSNLIANGVAYGGGVCDSSAFILPLVDVWNVIVLSVGKAVPMLEAKQKASTNAMGLSSLAITIDSSRGGIATPTTSFLKIEESMPLTKARTVSRSG